MYALNLRNITAIACATACALCQRQAQHALRGGPKKPMFATTSTETAFLQELEIFRQEAEAGAQFLLQLPHRPRTRQTPQASLSLA
jgi:hypothetical protein